MYLLIGIIISMSFGIPTIGTAENTDSQIIPHYSISKIEIAESDYRLSPGTNITPAITVQNQGGEPVNNSSLSFSATLGAVKLINNQVKSRPPAAGKERIYRIIFTVPYIQPGQYPLEITVTSDDADHYKGTDSMRAKSLVQVTHPKPGPGTRGCGCS